MEISQENILHFSKLCKNIFTQVQRDMIGQTEVVEGTIIAMIAGGNVLLEGVPGVGKTRLVRSLGRVFDLPFSRIQFTPDLMPADVTGTNIIVKDEKGNSTFSFQPGPIFSNIILADEINRATPKTQSALLEAMQEHTVTVMGVSRKLNEPFFVLATQNPIEQDGTYPLPEAQMDRFMFKLIVDMPNLSELKDIVNMTQKTMAEVADAACNGDDLLMMRKTANQILVADEVITYAMKLTLATHPISECAADISKKYVRVGASPRAGQALISAAKVKALLNGRFNVSFNDLNELACPVLRHRIKLNFEAVAERVSPDDIINLVVEEVAKEYKIPVKKTTFIPAKQSSVVEESKAVVNEDSEVDKKEAKARAKLAIQEEKSKAKIAAAEAKAKARQEAEEAKRQTANAEGGTKNEKAEIDKKEAKEKARQEAAKEAEARQKEKQQAAEEKEKARKEAEAAKEKARQEAAKEAEARQKEKQQAAEEKEKARQEAAKAKEKEKLEAEKNKNNNNFGKK